jgi:lysophospholipase L1-like esterase
MRILIFGDSITYGAWDSEGGWADRLKRWAHQQYVANGTKLQVINLGIGGNTSSKILARIENEITARHSSSWPFMIILMFGTNDGRVRGGETEVPIDAFTENYREIIATAKKFTEKVLVVGLPPAGAPKLDFKEMQYDDETIKEYESRIRVLAAEEALPFVEIRSLFASGDLFCADQLHPNDAGHTIIFEAVKKEVEELLG